MKIKSVKFKILTTIVVTGVFFGSIMGLFMYYYLFRVLTDRRVNEISSVAGEQVHESAEIIHSQQLFARMLATNGAVSNYLEAKTVSKGKSLATFFSSYTSEDKDILAIYLLDKSGHAIVSTDPRFQDQDYSFRDYYKSGIIGKATASVALGMTSNQFGYYFAHPVLDKNMNVIGVLVVKSAGGKTSAAIEMTKLSSASTMMLTDEFGIIIFSNNKDRILSSLGPLTEAEKQKLAQSNKYLGRDIPAIQYESAENLLRDYHNPVTIKIYDVVDKEDEIITVQKLHEFPFYLVSEIGLDDVRADVVSLVLIITSILLICYVLMSIVLYESFSVFINPLQKLKTLFQKISQGDFSNKAEIDTNDEFQDLAVSANKMSEELQGLYRHLDEKVKERTAQLSEAEERLSKSLKDAEKLNKFMVGREMEMIELKKQIAELTAEKKS